MKSIVFTIPGKPFGKQRPRTMKTGHTYTPKETVNYEALVKMAYQQQPEAAYFAAGEPVGLGIRAYYPVPASASKKARTAMLAGEVLPTKTPDCDNMTKIIADALNGIAYQDDRQIVVNVVRKHYAETARVEVLLWGVETAPEHIEKIYEDVDMEGLRKLKELFAV